MASTQLADVIVPAKFLPYMIQRTAALSAFIKSGIVQRTPEFDGLVNGSGGVGTGGIISMPFWTDITDARQILSDTAALTTNKIDGSNKDAAVKQGSGTAYSANQLAPLLIDGDPMAAVAELLAEYWNRTDQATLIAMLKGVFLANVANNSSDQILNIFTEDGANATDANKLNGSTFIDACQIMGDSKMKLTGLAVHSAVEAALLKNDLIDFIVDSDGKTQIPTFQGRTVIVDDNLPSRAGTTTGTVYTSYLFGEGAFGYGEMDLTAVPVEGGFGSYGLELARSAGVGDSILYSRRIFLLHPRGVKWTNSSVAGKFPTDAELGTAANWTRVFEKKNVRLVQVNHNA